MEIPILDIKAEMAGIRSEVTEAIERVVSECAFINGPDVKQFEQEVTTFLGSGDAIGVNSGTDAIMLGLRAVGVGPGDDVIAPAFTFFATASAIHAIGAKAIYVDVEPDSLNIDPAQIADRRTPNTKAVVPVHLYGRPAAMDPLMKIARELDLKVVEDAAQSFGARYRDQMVGLIGDIGAYSFFPSKVLGGCGDGGMVVSRRPELAEQVRMLKAHGSRKKYHNEMFGYNSRLDTIQAAVLRIKLKHIAAWIEQRNQVADRYRELLAGIDGITLPEVCTHGTHAYHQFTIRIHDGRRDQVKESLASQGIGTMIYYPIPVPHLPVYRGQFGSFPHAESAAQEVLSLPIWPTLSLAKQEKVAQSLRQAL